MTDERNECLDLRKFMTSLTHATLALRLLECLLAVSMCKKKGLLWDALHVYRFRTSTDSCFTTNFAQKSEYDKAWI